MVVTQRPLTGSFGNRCYYEKWPNCLHTAEVTGSIPVSPTATVLVSGCEGRPQGFLLLSVPRASHARPPNCSAPAVSRDDVTAPGGRLPAAGLFVTHDYERPAEARLGELAGAAS
jgi:hypothetical protein